MIVVKSKLTEAREETKIIMSKLMDCIKDKAISIEKRREYQRDYNILSIALLKSY